MELSMLSLRGGKHIQRYYISTDLMFYCTAILLLICIPTVLVLVALICIPIVGSDPNLHTYYVSTCSTSM
jgi:hypothetical protein